MIKKIVILCSIFLNLCIVRWEPAAIRMTWEAVGGQTFTFYTENSNVFAFFVCLLVAVCQVICLFIFNEGEAALGLIFRSLACLFVIRSQNNTHINPKIPLIRKSTRQSV